MSLLTGGVGGAALERVENISQAVAKHSAFGAALPTAVPAQVTLGMPRRRCPARAREQVHPAPKPAEMAVDATVLLTLRRLA